MTTWISSTLPGLCLRRCLGQRPVSRVPAAAAGAEWAGPQEGGPRRMEVGRGKRMVALLSRAFRTAGIVLE